MRVSLSANLLSWLTRAIHSWSSWLPIPSPVVQYAKMQHNHSTSICYPFMIPKHPIPIHWKAWVYSSILSLPFKQELIWSMRKCVVASPSLSFSLSSFLLFLLEDLLWEDWEAPVCPALLDPPAENDEEEEEELARTLLPQRAQESSCKSTGETPSSTRKLTWSKKYNTAGQRREQKWGGTKKQHNFKMTALKSLLYSI